MTTLIGDYMGSGVGKLSCRQFSLLEGQFSFLEVGQQKNHMFFTNKVCIQNRRPLPSLTRTEEWAEKISLCNQQDWLPC